MNLDRELIIVGDRVLIAPDTDKERTGTGLFLPQGLAEKEKVQSGYVFKVGPGYVLPSQGQDASEPWLGTGASRSETQFVPLQVKEGDYALFLRSQTIDIEYENKKYVILPHAAILAVVREKFPTPEL